MIFLLPGLAFSGFCIWCIILLAKSRGNYVLRAWGWLSICSFPAVIVQNTKWLAGTPSMSIDAQSLYLTLPYSWWVLSCGQTVVKIFDENVKNWTGHRQSTMLDNWPVFFGLGLIQAIILSLIVAHRMKGGEKPTQGLALVGGIFMCVNAMLATSFNWAGT